VWSFFFTAYMLYWDKSTNTDTCGSRRQWRGKRILNKRKILEKHKNTEKTHTDICGSRRQWREPSYGASLLPPTSPCGSLQVCSNMRTHM